MTNWIVTLFKAIGSILFILTILSSAISGMAVGGLLGTFGGPNEATNRAFMGFAVGGVVGLVSATALYGLVFVAISIDAYVEKIAYLQERNNILQSDAIQILGQVLAELKNSKGDVSENRVQLRRQGGVVQDLSSQSKVSSADDEDEKAARLAMLEAKPLEELLSELRRVGYTVETLDGGTRARLSRDGNMVLAESKRSLASVLDGAMRS